MRFWEFLFVLGTAVIQISANECITPNGYTAQCQRLDNCTPLASFLQRKPAPVLSTYERQFINMLVCYIDDQQNPFVCCAHNDPFIQRITPPTPVFRFKNSSTTPRPISNDLPDPLKYECGSVIIKDKITNGNETELGEYPWMALLEYVNNGIRIPICGGSLIHQRYVLTAAHCITNTESSSINVRLGEHTVSSDPDCSQLDPTECADPVINVGVARLLTHGNYFTNNQNRMENDIALLRLAKDIEMTTYIQPICFPTTDMNSPSGTNLFVSGWGQTENGLGSDIKLHVSVPIVSFRSCQRSLYGIVINNGIHICAGGEQGKDSCGGDSGGPLMVFIGGRWYLEGIVSFGTIHRCGTPGKPSVYTRVNTYRAWVLNIIQRNL